MSDCTQPTIGVVSRNKDLGYIKLNLLSKDSKVEIWLEKFELAATKMGLDRDSWTREVFLLMDEDVYETCKNLGMTPTSKYDSLHAKLILKYGKKMSSRDSQRIFVQRIQSSEESISDYYSALCGLSISAFPNLATESAEEITLNQFLSGIYNQRVKENLLISQPSSLEKALKEAIRLEDILGNQDYQVSEVKESRAEPINKISEQFNRLGIREIIREEVAKALDNQDGSRPRENTNRNRNYIVKCYNCGRVGHVAKYCRSRYIFLNTSLFSACVEGFIISK